MDGIVKLTSIVVVFGTLDEATGMEIAYSCHRQFSEDSEHPLGT